MWRDLGRQFVNFTSKSRRLSLTRTLSRQMAAAAVEEPSLLHVGCCRGKTSLKIKKGGEEHKAMTDSVVNQESSIAVAENDCSWFGWLSWRPTSDRLLEMAEKQMLRYVRSKIHGRYVKIGDGNRIWSVEINTENKSRSPLVMVHGFGSGAGLWAMNYDDISKTQPLYAFDVLGFGRSSRPSFPSEGAEVETEFVEAVERWRKEVGLTKFILLGHSLGGYLACAYALRYPHRVRHLILADPWGMNEKPPPGEEPFRIPRWARFVAAMLSPFNPFSALRAAGPLGPNIVQRFRPDLKRKFSRLFPEEEDNTVLNYVYHCNAQNPSGEAAFKSLTLSFGWAKYPMIHRIKDIDANVPMTILYGSRSWVDSTTGYNIKYLRKESYVDVQIVRGSGHHIYADQPERFNWAVTKVCNLVAREDGEDVEEVSPPIFPTIEDDPNQRWFNRPNKSDSESD